MKTFFGWLIGIGTLVGAVAIWWSRRNQVEGFREALEVQKLKQAIAQDAAKVEELKGQGDAARKEREQLEVDIAESKARATELLTATSLEGMSDVEVARALSDAGF